jgi:ParB family transcriptional regulator, chromosome partitioning protein
MSKSSKTKSQQPVTAPVRLIDISTIYVAERLRALQDKGVKQTADSMALVGQLQPIVVRRKRRDDGLIAEVKYVLVAGLHRLEAAKQNNWTQIQAAVHDEMDNDTAKLAEIDENLKRSNLSELEETKHLKLRKEIYERLHPETKHGAVGRKGKSARSEQSFVQDTAEKTGQGRSTVQRKVTRGKRLDDQALEDATGTSLDNAGEADALSNLPKEKQRKLAKAAKSGKKVSAKPPKPAKSTTPTNDAGIGDGVMRASGPVEVPLEQRLAENAVLGGETPAKEYHPDDISNPAHPLHRPAAVTEAPASVATNGHDEETSKGDEFHKVFPEIMAPLVPSADVVGPSLMEEFRQLGDQYMALLHRQWPFPLKGRKQADLTQYRKELSHTFRQVVKLATPSNQKVH